MSRKWRSDGDDSQLPEGITRTGYDAESSTHYFEDQAGNQYTSTHEYGPVTLADPPTQQEPLLSASSYSAHDTSNFMPPAGPARRVYRASEVSEEKQAWRSFAPFVLICLSFMFVLIWFVTSGSGDAGVPGGRPGDHRPPPPPPPPPQDCPTGAGLHTVEEGDTCWAIAREDGDRVAEIVRLNPQADCEALVVGQQLCVPSAVVGDAA